MIERHPGDIKVVIAIQDDLTTSLVSPSKHDKTLRNVLERAKYRNIMFNLKKIELRVAEVKFLRNFVSKEGLKSDPEKIKVIFEVLKSEKTQDMASEVLWLSFKFRLTIFGFHKFFFEMMLVYTEVFQNIFEIAGQMLTER